MRAYRVSVNLKLGLIISAVVIAVASLAYTQNLVERLRDKEQAAIQLWADAIEYHVQADAINPYERELELLGNMLLSYRENPPVNLSLSPEQADSMWHAVQWARSMPAADELDFVFNNIVVPDLAGVPAVITDTSLSTYYMVHNIRVNPSWSDERREGHYLRMADRMREQHEPILIDLGDLKQQVHYGDSELVQHLRIFPYVQLGFVSLFILVGYLGFSYVRRSEQSNLWVGMAKESAHQLGTPLTSMMGWLELLKTEGISDDRKVEILHELENDVRRLQRVSSRFSDIGSRPRLELMQLAPVTQAVATYIRRRMPQQGKRVDLQVEIDPEVEAWLNADLFEWVIENLLKNALDAIETDEGTIRIMGRREGDRCIVEVHDSGRGIDKRQHKNIFRPGYSTKKRGWGLGLSLAKRIVEDYHGGTLTLASSKPGEGSTFRITLKDPKGNG